MSVYVDEVRPIFGVAVPNGFTRRYKEGCHLMADSPEELEEFARKLKLRKDWRHGDHWDLSAAKRAKAVKLGALSVTSRWLVELRRKKRESDV